VAEACHTNAGGWQYRLWKVATIFIHGKVGLGFRLKLCCRSIDFYAAQGGAPQGFDSVEMVESGLLWHENAKAAGSTHSPFT
jgi:hypothetical protein